MRKNSSLFLFMLLLSVTVNAQTGWITKKLDDKLAVKFPVEPQIVNKAGVDSYLAKTNDSVKYSTTIIDYTTVAHIDSARLVPIKDNQLFADNLGNGIASKKTNYTFGGVTIGKWNTFTTYSMTGIENTTKSTVMMKMILIGTKLYNLSCLIPANMVTKNNELFFNSAEQLK